MSVEGLSKQVRSDKRASAVVAGAAGLLLISNLFNIPRASMISSQPWKVELFSSIFLLGAAVWLLLAKTKPGRHIHHGGRTLFALLALFIGWSGLSAAWAAHPLITVHHTLTWSVYAAFLFFFLYLFHLDGSRRTVLQAFALASIVMGLSCLFDFTTFVDFASAEAALRLRYAKYGEMMVIITPVVTAAALYSRDRRARAMYASAACLSWIAVMLSLSKASLLAGIGGMLVMFAGWVLFSSRALRRVAVVAAVVWLSFTVAFQVFFTAITAAPTTKDYIAGTAGNASLSANTRLLIWRVGVQMAAEHPWLGVGADNFGTTFNTARAVVAAAQPAGPEIAEDIILERAHNEPLQVLDELGIIGASLFILMFLLILARVFSLWRHNSWHLSPMMWAAVGGVVAFGGSSMVSSFSFRAIQNGLAFFMVLALILYEYRKPSRSAARAIGINTRRTGVCIAVVATLMLAYSGTKAVAESFLYRAEHTQDYAAAGRLCLRSLALDPDNAAAYYYLSARHANEDNYPEAAKFMSAAIEHGLGVSPTYSRLATYRSRSGDTAGALNSLAEGVRIFPRSVFLRVRYATTLEGLGRNPEADLEMRTAREIDERQAEGWYRIIRAGSVQAYYAAQADRSVAAPSELQPESAVLDFLDRTAFQDPPAPE